jgi:hypothetical protein
MRLPSELSKSFKLLSNSNLVQGNINVASINYFQCVLNDALPNPSVSGYHEKANLKLFVRGLHDINSHKRYNEYVSLVKGTTYECTILWTSPKTIMQYFKLYYIAYIKWDYNNMQYVVTSFTPSKKNKKYIPVEHPNITRFNQTVEHPNITAVEPDKAAESVAAVVEPDKAAEKNPKEVPLTFGQLTLNSSAITGRWSDVVG